MNPQENKLQESIDLSSNIEAQSNKEINELEMEEEGLTFSDDFDYGLNLNTTDCGNPLYEACEAALKQIPLVTISYKDYDADYATLLDVTQAALKKNGLTISSRTIYLADQDCYAVETRIKHAPSNQDFYLTRSIHAKGDKEFELAVKFSRLFGYITILGMKVKSEIPNLMLPINPDLNKAIPLSPKDINLFFDCQRCFYLKALHNITPSYEQEKYAFGNANDLALKFEANICRAFRRIHPLFKKNNINAIPFPGEIVKFWQDYAHGIQFFDEKNNFLLKGIIDDVFLNRLGELIVIEYKTINYEVDWNKPYVQKWVRQISFYAYLLSLLGYKVHNKCYIILNKPVNHNFDSKTVINLSDFDTVHLLFNRNNYDCTRNTRFEQHVKEISIDFDWIEPTLTKMRNCLDEKTIPRLSLNRMSGTYCQNCTYYAKTKSIEDKLNR